MNANSGKFVILAMPRTGSTMLVTALDDHPDITCHGELFLARAFKPTTSLHRAVSEIDAAYVQKDYRYEHGDEVLDALQARAATRWFGFKMMLNQNAELIERIVADPAWPILLLRRDNELACYSSHLIAKSEQNTSGGDGTSGRNGVFFDAEEFRKFKKQRAKKYDHIESMLQQSDRQFLPVDYASLVVGDIYAEVLDFLDVPVDVELTARTKKRNPSNILERFGNPEDVDLFLREENLEHWAREFDGQ